MSFLKNVWYFSAYADEIRAGGILSRTIAGEKIVMWESASGELAAFQDVCPHRMVPLSLGKHEGDGIRCAYHGLKFGPHGCIENPHGPITAALKPKTFILERRHGVLWLWLGDPEKADANDIPDFSFITKAPEHSIFKNRLDIAANHQLLVDNILDLSHADFLHPDTLGGGSTSAAKKSVREENGVIVARWDTSDHPAIPVFRREMPEPEATVTSFVEVRWRPSGAMTLEIKVTPVDFPEHPGAGQFTCHVMTPRDETSTHYFYCAARDYKTDDAMLNQFLAGAFYEAFAHEDKPMAEAQQAVVGAHNMMDLNPKLFVSDKAAVTARRAYDQALAND